MSARTILKHVYENGGMTEYQYERIDRVLKEREIQRRMIEVSGKWEKKSFYSEYFYCSECKYAYRHAFNFCPNCGMPMNEIALEILRKRERKVKRNDV